MRFIKYAFGILLFLFTSCIQPEPKNAEADILSITIQPSSALKDKPKITNDKIAVFVKSGLIDLTQVAPTFELTPGAIISPPSGTVRDFTKPQEYTVTSEDGKWNKTYKVSLLKGDIPLEFSFEHWQEDASSHFEIPYEIVDGEEQIIWATGSPGYALVVSSKTPEAYPTHATTDAFSGLAAYMETKEASAFVNKPIAAGNLFLGKFDASKAMSKPLQATQFGVPFDKKPLKFKGYYKYKPATPVIASDGKGGTKEMTGMRDSCQIYAILYLTDANTEWLDGSNALTSSNLVAKALLPLTDAIETPGNGFKHFEIDFEYINQPIDEEKLKRFEYKIAFVFSSSRNAAEFIGAKGSKLIVDEVKIEVE